MRTISFDTSSFTLHLSLLEGSTVVFEREVAPAGSERQEVASLLMPELDAAFRSTGWRKDQVEAICVGVGPGSFTGIRVAVITGRTLAQSFDVPVFGVSLLECLYVATGQMKPAALLLASTSAQYFYGAYSHGAQDPAAALLPPGAAVAEQLKAELAEVKLWYGDEKSCLTFAEESCQPLPKLKNVATAQAQLMFDRLSLTAAVPASKQALAKLAETFNWRNLSPLYLRSPSLTIKKNHATENPTHESR